MIIGSTGYVLLWSSVGLFAYSLVGFTMIDVFVTEDRESFLGVIVCILLSKPLVGICYALITALSG